jgi:ABC-type nickel/cobalt efflux system permease component RcnA
VNSPRLRRASTIAASLIFASGDALADGEMGVLVPLAGFGLVAGALAGYVAGYTRAPSTVFLGSVAAYVVLSWLGSMLYADSISAFMFSAAYTLLVGIMVFVAAYYVLRKLGRRLRRKHRHRAREHRRT